MLQAWKGRRQKIEFSGRIPPGRGLQFNLGRRGAVSKRGEAVRRMAHPRTSYDASCSTNVGRFCIITSIEKDGITRIPVRTTDRNELAGRRIREGVLWEKSVP
jgi:hypothetical protein